MTPALSTRTRTRTRTRSRSRSLSLSLCLFAAQHGGSNLKCLSLYQQTCMFNPRTTQRSVLLN